MFKNKVLKAHQQRIYGPEKSPSTGSCGSSCSDSKTEQQCTHTMYTTLSVPCETTSTVENEASSLFGVHEEFMKKQVKQAEVYKKIRQQLPREISSKRKVMDDCIDQDKEPEGDTSMEKKLCLESETKRGPRTVSSYEKNQRRKLKKKRRRDNLKSIVSSDAT